MKRGIENQIGRLGYAPGSSFFTETVEGLTPDSLKITLYNESSLQEAVSAESLNLLDLKENDVCWINAIGAKTPQTLSQFSTALKLHGLTIEDMYVLGQRPKLELFDDYIFTIFHSCDYVEGKLRLEQVSLLLKDNIVLSVQEFTDNDIFLPLMQRIEKKRGRVRKENANYLLYCLMDMVVDHYFVVIDQLQQSIDALEERLLENHSVNILEECNKLRQDILWMRQSVKPLMQMLEDLKSDEDGPFSMSHHYTQDLFDHVQQCLDNLDTMRNLISDLIELHSSYSNLRLSEIMKFLTMMSSIFIPISFITSFFGMNFNQMPGLSSLLVFNVVMTSMLCIVLGIIVYFWWKKWF